MKRMLGPGRWCPRAGFPAGSALIVSLVFIILITIVIVGFVTTAGLERKTVQSHYARVQADLFNTMAAGVVASRITLAASQTNAWMVSQPGRLATTTFAASPQTTFVDLTSGTAASVVADVSTELNIASLTQGTGVIVRSATTSLPVSWIYVRKDGRQDPAATTVPVYSASNPVVGRYAFWTDDESSRLNINTALSGKAAFGESDPDLTTLSTGTGTLSAGEVADLKTFRDPGGRRYHSVEDLKSADPSAAIAAAVDANRESLTHFSHAPGLNRFGEPRIVLTTQENLAGGRPFFDILAAPNTDPGIDANLDTVKVEALFAKLFPYFLKTAREWGISYSGTSPAVAPSTYAARTLFDKFKVVDGSVSTPNKDARVIAQIILNLIDYVRSVESSHAMVMPLRGAFPSNTAPNYFAYRAPTGGPNGSYNANGILGNSRRPHIVEMGVWLPDAPVVSGTQSVYSGTIKARVYWPENSGATINLATANLQLFSTVTPVGPSSFSVLSPTTFTITGSNVSVSENPVPPGGYCTITGAITIRPSGTNRPTTAAVRMGLIDAGAGLGLDLVPVHASGTNDAQYVFSGTGVSIQRMNSLSSNDPVISQSRLDWTLHTGTNTFGSQNRSLSSTLGVAAPLIPPQQDSDADGLQTDISTRPPSLKGTGDNLRGVVRSVGELGRIHAGGAGTKLRGTAWRTLRLQPRVAPQASLPDWLLLDLFTVPLVENPDTADAAEQADADLLLVNSGSSVGGRLNANGRVYPFPDALTRKAPLRAVLRSAKPALSDTEADALAANILNNTVMPGALTATRGLAYGPANFTAEKLYGMPGEICEISGIAPNEDEEFFVQNLLAYLTTRSNVFSVFSVGQKIQQLPNGRIVVLGESRTRTLLERENNRVRVVSTQELGL